MVMLRCMDKQEADMLIKEIYEASFVTHANRNSMANKIMREGYYWLTMETNYFHYTKTCHKCHIYAGKMHVPPSPLNVLTTTWPFSMWRIYMIGLIEPKAFKLIHIHLIVIDYFTKWVEATSYANVTKQVVVASSTRKLYAITGFPTNSLLIMGQI